MLLPLRAAFTRTATALGWLDPYSLIEIGAPHSSADDGRLGAAGIPVRRRGGRMRDCDPADDDGAQRHLLQILHAWARRAPLQLSPTESWLVKSEKSMQFSIEPAAIWRMSDKCA
jgi:hypothetical protein